MAKKQTLKQFRADVARLKKAGLIPANARGKTVNIKSAQPYQMFQGKKLADYLKDPDNRSILEGTSVAIKRSRIDDTQGYKVKKPKGMEEVVIVPSENARVSIERRQIKRDYSTPTGKIERVMIPRKQMKQYITDVESLPDLKKGESYAFFYYGNKSHRVFSSTTKFRAYFEKYPRGRKGKAEMFRNLELVRLDRPATNAWMADVDVRVKKQRSYKSTERSKAKRRVENMPFYKQEILRAQKRVSKRKERARKR